MSQALPAPLFDPFAPGFTDDPYPQYAALRAAAPVYHHPLGFWLLSRDPFRNRARGAPSRCGCR